MSSYLLHSHNGDNGSNAGSDNDVKSEVCWRWWR